MGIINWLLGNGKSAALPAPSTRPLQTNSHASLADATRPLMGGKQQVGDSASVTPSSPAQRLEQRRSERNARRELLFQVVRESMVRVGVLSSAFKFKVLALDQRGHTFLVMIDLSAEFAGETDKLAEIEALIAQSAKNRYELVVQAVYWRFYEAVSTSATRIGASSAPAPLFGMPTHTNSRPAPLSAVPFPGVAARAPGAQPVPATRPVPNTAATFVARPAPAPVARPLVPQTVATSKKSGADPLEQGEVDAFRRALASGSQPGPAVPTGGTSDSTNAYAITQAYPSPYASGSNAAALAASAAAAAKLASLAAINNKLLLTGYEDTEMPDPDAPVLSTTQYGELR